MTAPVGIASKWMEGKKIRRALEGLSQSQASFGLAEFQKQPEEEKLALKEKCDEYATKIAEWGAK